MTSFDHSPMTGAPGYNEAISWDVMVIALFDIRYINQRIMRMPRGSREIFGKFGCQMSCESSRTFPGSISIRGEVRRFTRTLDSSSRRQIEILWSM